VAIVAVAGYFGWKKWKASHAVAETEAEKNLLEREAEAEGEGEGEEETGEPVVQGEGALAEEGEAVPEVPPPAAVQEEPVKAAEVAPVVE
jgi:hypothetical protein